ncbi:hypothetical protein HDU67_003265 [Dinochytrium kinnereticum]|nr:hypothetical protein HDU67_003265 [Dinochytrium kinnereticum]
MFARSTKPLSAQVDILVPAPTKRNPDPNGLVVISHEDTAFTASVRIQSEIAIPNASLTAFLFVGQGALPEKTTKFDPQSSTAAAAVHRKPIFKSTRQIWTTGDIKVGTHDYPFVIDLDTNVPPTVTDPTVSDIKRDITYVMYAVLRVGNQQSMGRSEVTLRRGTVWTDPKKILLEGPMLDGRVKYQLFVPNIVHIGDPSASITICMNNLGNHALQLKSVQCTWVEVYTFEEVGRSPVSREHSLSKVLKLQDALQTSTDEVTQKFAIPQTEASPDCDHRAVAPNVHPLLKAYGGSAHVTHEVRIKVEYKLGRQVNLLIDGILARIPFNCVVHSGSGVVPRSKSGISSSGSRLQPRLSVMSGVSSSGSSIIAPSFVNSPAPSSPVTGRAGSAFAPSSYASGRRNSVTSMASGFSAAGSSVVAPSVAASAANITPPNTPTNPSGFGLYSSATVHSSLSLSSTVSTQSTGGYAMSRSGTNPISPASAISPPPLPIGAAPEYSDPLPGSEIPSVPMSSSDMTAHILESSEGIGGLPSYEPFVDLPDEEPASFMEVEQQQLELPTYSLMMPRTASLATEEAPPPAHTFGSRTASLAVEGAAAQTHTFAPRGASLAAATVNTPSTPTVSSVGPGSLNALLASATVLDPATLPPRTASSRGTSETTTVTTHAANAAPAYVPPAADIPRSFSMMKGPLPPNGVTAFNRDELDRSETLASTSSSATAFSTASLSAGVAAPPTYGVFPSRPPSPTTASSSPAVSAGEPVSAATEEPALAPSYVPVEPTSLEVADRLLRVETVFLNSEPPPPFSEFYDVGEDVNPAPNDASEPAYPPPSSDNIEPAPAFETLPAQFRSQPPEVVQEEVVSPPAFAQPPPMDMSGYTHSLSPSFEALAAPPAFEAVPPAVDDAEPALIPHLSNVSKAAVGRHVPATDGEIAVEIGDLVFIRTAWADGFAYGINLSTQVEGLFQQEALFGPSQPAESHPSPPPTPTPPRVPTAKRRSLPPPMVLPHTNPSQPPLPTLTAPVISLNRPVPTPGQGVAMGTQRSASVGVFRSEEGAPVRPARSTSFAVGGSRTLPRGGTAASVEPLVPLTPPKRSGSFMTGNGK